LTCGECCSVCPAFFEGEVFSPMKILRMTVLGLIDSLLSSPSIWLCLGCQRCAEVCSQNLSIFQVIQRLQLMAVEKSVVQPFFKVHFQEKSKSLLQHFITEVDAIFQNPISDATALRAIARGQDAGCQSKSVPATAKELHDLVA
ncbi:MAG: 4Fe-4S dicluster domain-containing protein, partial [Desulfobacteraceae bacterium]|nr:4Fe-4S dicluster domain-containing protein [Desulfobacteraceae bacterium]